MWITCYTWTSFHYVMPFLAPLPSLRLLLFPVIYLPTTIKTTNTFPCQTSSRRLLITVCRMRPQHTTWITSANLQDSTLLMCTSWCPSQLSATEQHADNETISSEFMRQVGLDLCVIWARECRLPFVWLVSSPTSTCDLCDILLDSLRFSADLVNTQTKQCRRMLSDFSPECSI